MRPLLGVLLVLLPMVASLAGCLTCKPTLDVRHCPDAVRGCAPQEGDPVQPWSDVLADLWPDLPRLMDASHHGHQHATWTQNQADAFWAFWNVPEDRDDKQVFFTRNDTTYRVRILAC